MRAMPRRRSPPRLCLDRTRGTWFIRDGGAFVRLGLPERDRAAAELRLRDYLAAKYQPPRSDDPLIADCLGLYASEHVPHTATARRSITYHLQHLLNWWDVRHVSDVTATTCREYARATGSAFLCAVLLGNARCCDPLLREGEACPAADRHLVATKARAPCPLADAQRSGEAIVGEPSARAPQKVHPGWRSHGQPQQEHSRLAVGHDRPQQRHHASASLRRGGKQDETRAAGAAWP